MRIGQDKSRHQRAVKVWDKREFKNLDDSIELGTRNIKVALKRLRKWARDGADQELILMAQSALPQNMVIWMCKHAPKNAMR